MRIVLCFKISIMVYVITRDKERLLKMKKIKITAKEAHKLAEELGLCISDDGRTFYATNKERTEIWEFDSKRERDNCLGA